MIVQSVAELPNLSKWDWFVCDTETSGLSPHQGHRICSIIIGPVKGVEAWYIPIRHELFEGEPYEHLSDLPEAQRDRRNYVNLDPAAVYAWLKPYFDNPEIRWTFHNAKFDLSMFRADGMFIKGRVNCTMLLAHVLDGGLFSYALDSLTRKYLKGFKHVEYTRVDAFLNATQKRVTATDSQKDKTDFNYSLVPICFLGPYGLEDILATRMLLLFLMHAKLKPAIPNQGNFAWSQLDLLKHEMKLLRVIGEMEWNGARLDVKKCAYLREKTEGEVENYLRELFQMAGRHFNPGSYVDMGTALEAVGGRVLFWTKPERKHAHKYPALLNWEFKGKQKLDHFTEVKAKSTGRACWNAAAQLLYLKRFRKEGNRSAFAFMRTFREWDTRRRILTMYLEKYLKLVDKNGFIHGSFNQHSVVTGRLSSNNPNLQCVSKVKGTADQKAFEQFLGEKEDDALNRVLRSLFIPRPGNVLVSIDQSQIEYRTAAYLAQDPVLLERYKNDPATDYHAVTAELCGIDRDLAKVPNFGTLYGMGGPGLASTLTAMGIETSKEEGYALLNKIFAARPALKKLLTTVADFAKKYGYIQNASGRVCPVPKALAYKAVNYLDQGMCGDLMRYCLVKCQEHIEKNNWPVFMVMTVHDEIVFDMPRARVREYAPQLAKIIGHSPFMPVPILCDIEVGNNWAEQVALEKWSG